MKTFLKLFEFLNPKTTPVIDNQYIKLKDLIGNKLSGQKDSNKFLKEYIRIVSNLSKDQLIIIDGFGVDSCGDVFLYKTVEYLVDNNLITEFFYMKRIRIINNDEFLDMFENYLLQTLVMKESLNISGT